MVSAHSGLGRNYQSLTKEDYSHVALFEYANQVTLFLAIGFCKLATLMLIRRLFGRDAKASRIICNAIATLLFFWTMFAAVLVSVGCPPESIAPRDNLQTCPNLAVRYQVVLATDIFTDAILVLLPAYLVSQLHMTTKLKIQVTLVFAFRLPLIPLAILGSSNFVHSFESPNPGVDRALAIVFQQSQLCLSLIAATLPCLKSFIRSFDTGGGLNVNYGSGSRSGYDRGQSYHLRSLTKGRSDTSSRDAEQGTLQVSRSRDGIARTITNSTPSVTATTHGKGTSGNEDTSSHESQELFIRRDVQWEVRSENLSMSCGNSTVGEEAGIA
ncbi:hypothetical protein M011DRAFT_467378 [Sporormia fimetaria CBS 119925]|uniref:Rhodopsin domain-containing protein n=1 Tax=Sporormia fimetaria CBS 119925 TaxID=1340428 RepID=A0A6A6VB60_9PLEO|nr:hypothetical protein M011DRAFT_467378 [Sporormia fimetaria CBS 119925]